MRPASYPGPAGGTEIALAFDADAFDTGYPIRLLVIPALFDEGNKLRRFTVEVMRRLAASGVASILPDLPGCHESLAPLPGQSIASWREAMGNAAQSFGASHVLSIRAGAVLAPAHLPGWRLAATTGASMLRGLLRARVIAAREAGHEENSGELLARGRTFGLDLAGYRLGPVMVAELEHSRLPDHGRQVDIAQADLGGPGLWLRAEPSESADQADALAARILMELAA